MTEYHSPLRTMFRLLVVLLVIAGPAYGQEVPYTLKVDVPLVSLDITVTDNSGQPVTDLKMEDFQVFENGVPQKIRYFSPIAAPYNILLLFDRSGSTEHKWPFMQRAVAGFIANLRPQDRIRIATFDSDLSLLTSWDDDRRAAIGALQQLMHPQSSGVTEFYRAVESVVKQAFKNVNGRRLVVVLTDGRDSWTYKAVLARNRIITAAEDRPFQRTLKTVREQRVPVHFVAINTDRNFEPNTAGADEFRNLQRIFPDSTVPQQFLSETRSRMELLADAAGGRIVYPHRFEDIVPLYEQIGRELGTAYSLSYIPEDQRGGELRRIEVRTVRENLRVTQSRTTYYVR